MYFIPHYLYEVFDYEPLHLRIRNRLLRSRVPQTPRRREPVPHVSKFEDNTHVLLEPLARTCTPDEKEFIRSVRARSASPNRSITPGRVHVRSTSIPPHELSPIVAKVFRYTPKINSSPSYTYLTRYPSEIEDTMDSTPRRISSPSPLSFGPRIYTSLSVFPSMRHSSYNLMAPIDRYRYRTTSRKQTGDTPSSYLGYPTPTTSTASAYRQSDLYPNRFQINNLTSPSVERFHAGRRTLY